MKMAVMTREKHKEDKMKHLVQPRPSSTFQSFNVLKCQNQNESPEEPAVGDPETGTFTLPRVARPSLYKVILLNDDFTPMDFVISILKKFFSKSDGEAQRIMLEVHQNGAAIAGVYTFEVAETKVYLVNEFSRRHKFPLKCIMEKEASDENAS